MRVRDVMTRDVLTARVDTRLKAVAELLAAQRISGLPVVDNRDRLVGVVSEGDILLKELGPQRGGLLGRFGHVPVAEQKLAAHTAGEAMTAPAVSVSEDAPVHEAASLMVERAVNRLPVVDVEGALVGIVTRADLVRSFARPDEEIAREIRADVLLGTLWIDPSEVDVQVENGEVVLAGQVETRGTAELAALFARRVLGVVEVRSRLGWRHDDSRSPPPLPI
jgi:CBS domain-containing protein